MIPIRSTTTFLSYKLISKTSRDMWKKLWKNSKLSKNKINDKHNLMTCNITKNKSYLIIETTAKSNIAHK